jgi:polysaccharide export outer membrane protein
MKQYVTFLLLLTGLITISSCKTYDKMVYFQGNSTEPLSSSSNYIPILKSDDLLSVTISGDDPESVIPFNNAAAVGSAQSGMSGYTQGNPFRNGYLIDTNGEITLPVIGKVKVAGRNRQEAAEDIQQKLTEYIKNPIVNIQIENYKITLLGDVKTPGTYKIPNERITLLEAIGLAGDLKMTGNRKNILVIRDNNGKKTEYRVDMTSKQLFASPVYYLAQNDVVYVEPNRAARTESTTWRATGPMIVSLTSLVVTTITLLTR